MLQDIDCSYIIVGHSERRAMGESDSVVAAKASAAIRAGLRPIICIGEAEHDAQGAYLGVVGAQIKASLEGIDRSSVGKIVIAYEPIWAIGAKEAMSPELIQEMMIFVRKTLSDIYGQDAATDVPVLYGGTVNARNVKDITERGSTDGLLVGRESLNREGFKQLLKIADECR
jgi:triosephosphate isomerase